MGLLLFSYCSLPFNQGHQRRHRHPSTQGSLTGSALRHIPHVQGQDESVVSDYCVPRDTRTLM